MKFDDSNDDVINSEGIQKEKHDKIHCESILIELPIVCSYFIKTKKRSGTSEKFIENATIRRSIRKHEQHAFPRT